jgi:hypothetical protein
MLTVDVLLFFYSMILCDGYEYTSCLSLLILNVGYIKFLFKLGLLN